MFNKKKDFHTVLQLASLTNKKLEISKFKNPKRARAGFGWLASNRVTVIDFRLQAFE